MAATRSANPRHVVVSTTPGSGSKARNVRSGPVAAWWARTEASVSVGRRSSDNGGTPCTVRDPPHNEHNGFSTPPQRGPCPPLDTVGTITGAAGPGRCRGQTGDTTAPRRGRRRERAHRRVLAARVGRVRRVPGRRRRGRVGGDRAARPDLVVLDLAMPGLGGLDVLRRIRDRDGEAGALPIIVLSGRSGETDRIEGQADRRWVRLRERQARHPRAGRDRGGRGVRARERRRRPASSPPGSARSRGGPVRNRPSRYSAGIDGLRIGDDAGSCGTAAHLGCGAGDVDGGGGRRQGPRAPGSPRRGPGAHGHAWPIRAGSR